MEPNDRDAAKDVETALRKSELARTHTISIALLVLGAILIIYVFLSSQVHRRGIATPTLIIILISVFFGSHFLRERVIPKRINNLISLGGVFAGIVLIILETGGANSYLHILFVLMPPWASYHYGRRGMWWSMSLIVAVDAALVLISLTSMSVGSIVDGGFEMFMPLLIALPIAYGVENGKMLYLRMEEEKKLAEKAHKELKDAEEKMLQSAKLAAIGEMAAGIVHELSQPLSSLQVYARLAKSKVTDHPELADDISVIEDEIDKMGDIVSSIRSFARKPETDFKPLDIGECTRNVLHLVAKKFEDRGIKITATNPNGLPKVAGDRNQIEQVMLNILNNAGHAVESNHKTGRSKIIKVGAQVFNNGDFVCLSVSDNGCGISKDLKHKIFEPFYTNKGSSKGLGLGLPICQKIVKSHGGTIDVDSSVSEGTTVSVILPVYNTRPGVQDEKDQATYRG